MKGWFLEQLTGSICLIEFVKILCEKSPNYADQANSSQMEQIEVTFWLSLHLLWGGAEMDSIRSQLIKLVLFLREAEVRERPPFRDISLIKGAEVSRSSGLFPVNGKRRLRCQWNQVIAGSLESAYSLNWGAREIWGKGEGETLALLL